MNSNVGRLTGVSNAIRMLILLLCVFSSSALAQFTLLLRSQNSIPSYCQEAPSWCGPAVIQMILEGFPGSVNHSSSQTDIWARVEAHRNDPQNDPLANWSTDPDNLHDRLMELGNDPGVNWSIYSKPSKEEVMYSVMHWMAIRKFPTASLVDKVSNPSIIDTSNSPSDNGSFRHWVVVTGFTSDVDPISSSLVNLQYVDIIDPWKDPCPQNTAGGYVNTYSGASWYANFMDVPGFVTGSKWNGTYVAVVEPPDREGTAIVPILPYKGKIISVESAKTFAIAAFNRLLIDRKDQYSSLQGASPRPAMLVNQKSRPYYLVPFGDNKSKLSSGAVVVNAFSGEFEQISLFPEPAKYIYRNQAIALALKELCNCNEKIEKEQCTCVPKDLVAQLIYFPTEEVQSRLFPFWKIYAFKKIVYVTQRGKIFHKLTVSLPGD